MTYIKPILIAAFLIFLWNISAWFIAKDHYLSRANEIIEQETKLSQERASDLADSIQRNLNYLDGIPALLSQSIRIKKAISSFGVSSTPSPLLLDDRKKRWTEGHALKDLSQYLALAKTSFNVDLIYVVNAAGDCIAASNFDTPGTSIGTNFAERDFFRMNRNGQIGMQYAMGKTTHIPGLFFSSPVIIEGRFLGAVVAKIDVPSLSFLIKQVNAFVTDANGVTILAHDKEIEMHSMPAASVLKMTEKKRIDYYIRSSFPVIQIERWEKKHFPSLMRFQNKNIPYIFASKEVPEYGMKIYVATEIPAIQLLERDSVWFAFMLGLSGSVLILIASGAVFYFQSIKKSRGLLSEQNNQLEESRQLLRKMADQEVAKREEERKRIARELHDELGQMLAAVKLDATWLANHLSSEKPGVTNRVDSMFRLINETMDAMRRIAADLRPAMLDDLGLAAAVEWLAEEFSKRTGACIQTALDLGAAEDDLKPGVVTAAFRIVQESLTNVARHAEAKHVLISLKCQDGKLTLLVSDDGKGISEANENKRNFFGVAGMRERALGLGGTLNLSSIPGEGTTVEAIIPIESVNSAGVAQ